MKRMLFVFSALLLILAGMGAETAGAANSGTCGAGVNWVLRDDGTLTISGNGAMALNLNPIPWTRSQVKKVVVEPGVTAIPENAFKGCAKLTTLHLTEGLQSIGKPVLNGDTVTVSICTGGEPATVFCAVYKENGQMAGVRSASVNGVREGLRFQFSDVAFSSATVFLANENGAPLCMSRDA